MSFSYIVLLKYLFKGTISLLLLFSLLSNITFKLSGNKNWPMYLIMFLLSAIFLSIFSLNSA